MADLAMHFGYLGLFVFSLLSSTLIAAPSDIMAMAMPQAGYNPWIVGIVATAGGYVGNLINYGIGKYGAEFFLSRWVSSDESQRERSWRRRAERLYERYGVFTLLFSGTPFVGDPLTTIAGAFHVDLKLFTLLVIIGKLVKFALLLSGASWIADIYR